MSLTSVEKLLSTGARRDPDGLVGQLLKPFSALIALGIVWVTTVQIVQIYAMTIVFLGLMLSRNLQAFELTPAELGFVMQGINDGASGKETAVKMEEYAPKVQALGQAKSDKRAAAE